MEYSGIIKKAWRITWRYRALWWLGLFAGITGWSGGGGSTRGSTGSSASGPSTPFHLPTLLELRHVLVVLLPALIAFLMVLFAVGIVWWILGIAARGGLVRAVDGIEEGQPVRLGEAWSAGFRRWGGTFVLELVLKLPIVLVGLLAFMLIVVPILVPLSVGARPTVAAIPGVCGGFLLLLVVGLPLSFLLGLTYVVALRHLMLDGLPALDSISAGFADVRSRFKDVALMWLINWGLNIAAGIAFAIPVVVLVLGFGFAGLFSGISALHGGSWWPVIGSLGSLVVVLIALSWLFVGIWGTFTSSLWTVFFRRMTGREVVVAAAVAPAPMPAPASAYPAPDASPPAPMPPQPPTQ